ncbi:biotin transporter BioY [Enterococcus sp. LJL98]
MRFVLREQLLAAMFAGIIAVGAQIIIPLGFVPLSLQTFTIGLTATLLGRRTGTWAISIYLLLGLVGLPVFAGGKSGFGVLFGPTGGYLIGFIFASILIGSLRKNWTYFSVIGINLIGFLLALTIGAIWLSFVADLTFVQGFNSGFLPFLLPEVLKAIGVGFLAVLIKKRLPEKFFHLA